MPFYIYKDEGRAMRKNSKVMNALMSLFLVMGMVFQVTPVTAQNIYSESKSLLPFRAPSEGCDS